MKWPFVTRSSHDDVVDELARTNKVLNRQIDSNIGLRQELDRQKERHAKLQSKYDRLRTGGAPPKTKRRKSNGHDRHQPE